MKSILRAFAVLSASSVVTIVAGIVTMKVIAVEVGPAGLGFLALLQSLLGVVGIVAGFGIGTALVRLGAEAIGDEEPTRVASLWKGAWLLYWSLSVPIAALLVVFRVPVARFFLGDAANTEAVAWVALALVFALAGTLNASFINANHRVSRLARLAVYVAIIQTPLAVVIILLLGHEGIPFVVLSGSVVAWAVSRWLVSPLITRHSVCSMAGRVHMARPLLSFGGPFALSSMVGGGVMMVLPIVVVTLLDQTSVGYVRAASAISVTYVGFLLKAMSQDYFPRLSAVSRDHARINEMVNQQLDALYLVAVPFVFLTMAFAPVAIPILYSRSFVPSIDILEWQLVGDVFKFTSWALAFTILARGRTWTYLGTESIAGALLLGTTFVGLNLLGLEGYGLAYAVSYAGYLGLVYVFVRSGIGFRFTADNLRRLVLFGGSAIAVRLIVMGVESAWIYVLPGVIGVVSAILATRRGAAVWRSSDAV